MRRAVLFGLVVLTGTGGCANPRVPGVVAAYEPGQKPTSAKVPYDVVVELHARGQPTSTGPITSTGVTGGTRVGFRREPGGPVVAFVGERPVRIPDGRCEWVVVSSSWPRWWARRVDDAERVTRAAGEALTVTAIGVGAVTLGAAYLYAQGQS